MSFTTPFQGPSEVDTPVQSLCSRPWPTIQCCFGRADAWGGQAGCETAIKMSARIGCNIYRYYESQNSSRTFADFSGSIWYFDAFWLWRSLGCMKQPGSSTSLVASIRLAQIIAQGTEHLGEKLCEEVWLQTASQESMDAKYPRKNGRRFLVPTGICFKYVSNMTYTSYLDMGQRTVRVEIYFSWISLFVFQIFFRSQTDDRVMWGSSTALVVRWLEPNACLHHRLKMKSVQLQISRILWHSQFLMDSDAEERTNSRQVTELFYHSIGFFWGMDVIWLGISQNTWMILLNNIAVDGWIRPPWPNACPLWLDCTRDSGWWWGLEVPVKDTGRW